MPEHRIEIARSWALADALAAVARDRSCGVTFTDGEPTLKMGGRCWALPDPAECGRIQASLVLGLIADSLSPGPLRALATIIAPAAGHCGPCATGPIDAIRDDGACGGWTIGAQPIPWSAHTVRVQQSRSWLVHATLDGTQNRHASPRSTLRVLPPAVARDTARISEYQLDRGAGAYWSDTLLLGPPQAHDGWVVVRAVHTDGVLAAHLLDRALACVQTLADR